MFPAGSGGVVGILAGGGSLPRELAERIEARGGRVAIVALPGADRDGLAPFPVTHVRWGEVGRMLRALSQAGAHELVIVGSARRPDLSTLRPDLGLFLNLPAALRIIASGGDDSLLTRVVGFFEAKGFVVVSPAAIAPELVVGCGPLGAVAATAQQAEDVARGFEVVCALGPYDVGQAVVVAGGHVRAIEGAEGTDAMLERVATLRRAAGAEAVPEGVLVKRPKPRQELRVDMPAIGPGTVERAAAAGLGGVGVLAGGTLAAEKAELVRRADAAGLYVEGFRDTVTDTARRGTRCVAVNWRSATRPQRADAAKGAILLQSLGPLVASRAVVVDRGHVLAVESGEGAAAAIARAGTLRQWGRRRWARRSGVAVLNDAADLRQCVENSAEAGLAAVIVLGQPSEEFDRAAAEADRHGICLAAPTPTVGPS